MLRDSESDRHKAACPLPQAKCDQALKLRAIVLRWVLLEVAQQPHGVDPDDAGIVDRLLAEPRLLREMLGGSSHVHEILGVGGIANLCEQVCGMREFDQAVHGHHSETHEFKPACQEKINLARRGSWHAE